MQTPEFDPEKRRTIACLAALTSTCIAGSFQTAGATSLSKELDSAFRRTDELSGLLRGAAISVRDWRNGLNTLFSNIELEELLASLDFQSLSTRTGFAPLGVRTVRVTSKDGSTKPVHFIPRFFAIGAGRAIIPHGHRGMVSAHLVLRGSLRLRQYDTLDISDDYLELKQTVDRIAAEGDLSSIGLKQDNAHWFVAEQDSHTLDTIVTGLRNKTAPSFEIFNVDMDRAEPTAEGTILAPRLDVQAALRKYG